MTQATGPEFFSEQLSDRSNRTTEPMLAHTMSRFQKPGTDTPWLIDVAVLDSCMSDRPTTETTGQAAAIPNRPQRGADENRPLGATDGPVDGQLLPSLDAGVTLLDSEATRGVPVLQALVLDHLLGNDGPALWVDADGHATTTTFARIAPSKRLLDRVHVARGFTAYQHYAAVCNLPAAIGDRSARAGPDHAEGGDHVAGRSPALVVAPAVDARYRDDETLTDHQARTLQTRVLARLRTFANEDVPVLLTRRTADGFTEPVETVADRRLRCEQTSMGPRFVGDEFETRLYPVADGTGHQTTFAYWRQLLEARAARASSTRMAPDPTEDTTAVGRGTTIDGETVTTTPNPLLDAGATAPTAGGW